MSASLPSFRPLLIGLTKTDPSPQVRHRAHLVLALLANSSVAAAARATGVSEKSLRHWRDRFLAEGRSGLVDRPRGGRPSRFTPAADQLLDEALAQSPMDTGYPVATWGLVDLADLLQRRCGVAIGTEALSRHLKRRGYVYRRPRHDLKHRQDADAIASAQHTLQKLQKRGLIALDTGCSTLTNAPSTPIPTWQRYGNAEAIPPAFAPPAPISGSPSSGRSTIDRARSVR